LPHAAARLEAVGETLGEELRGLRPYVARCFRRIERGVQTGELCVGGGDRGGERDASLGCIGARRIRFGGRGRERGAVLAPEVELPGEVERRAAVVVPSLRCHHGWRDVV